MSSLMALFPGVRKRCKYTVRPCAFILVLALIAAPAAGQDGLREQPLARSPAVSPDGETVAFSYQGDIFRVASEGGLAIRLTAHEAYDARPEFGPEGERIAFQSTRWGTPKPGILRSGLSQDLLVMDVDGSNLKRLTYHSADDQLGGWTPEGNLLFSTRRTWAQVEWEKEIYKISSEGGTPNRQLDAVGIRPVASPDGRFLAFSSGATAYGPRRLRPGHRGSATQDLWLYDKQEGSYSRITTFEGNDVRPAWTADRTLLFLSDRGAGDAYNIYRVQLNGGGMPRAKPKPVTRYQEHSVWSFGASQDGSTVVYERKGALWIDGENRSSELLDVQIPADGHTRSIERETIREDAQDYAISPAGDRIALVVRGDLYLTDNEPRNSRTVRLTDNPGRDRDPAWLNDSTLVFASDRDGDYDLYQLTSADTSEPRLYYSLKYEVDRLTDTDVPERRPVVAPSGDKLAYVESNLWVTARGRALLGAEYEDGTLTGTRPLLSAEWGAPLDVSWSPDGRWLAYSRFDLNFNEEVYLIRADGSAGPVNVSQHPKPDTEPIWGPKGKKLAFLSARNNDDRDVWVAWLREEDWQRTQEDWSLIEERREEKAGASGDSTQVDSVEIDTEGLYERLTQVTALPGHESDLAISEDGQTFYFVSNGAGRPSLGGEKNIWKASWDGTAVEEFTSGGDAPEDLTVGPTGHHLHFRRREGTLARAAIPAGKEEILPFAARMEVNRQAQRAQVFDEAWRLVDRHFYDPQFHGDNWEALRDTYRPRALKASSRQDFEAVFNRMLAELNASHLRFRASSPPEPRGVKTGLLGLELDPVEEGVRIEHVVAESPADRERSKLQAGDIITAVGGTSVSEAPNFYALLADQVSRRTVLTVQNQSGESREVVIRPTGSLNEELRKEWVERRRELTDKYSGGRLGYIHVNLMFWESFERFQRELQAAANGKEGLIVDVRFNPGGWTADHLLTVLSYRQHAYTIPRGAASNLDNQHEQFQEHYPYSTRLPHAAWTGPVATVADQHSHSNAEIFSHAFKQLNLGPLVGEPTYGGVISTGGTQLADGSEISIPFRAWYVKATNQNMEHGPAVPDHRVPTLPHTRANGEDEQLRKAVNVLLEQIEEDGP